MIVWHNIIDESIVGVEEKDHLNYLEDSFSNFLTAVLYCKTSQQGRKFKLLKPSVI